MLEDLKRGYKVIVYQTLEDGLSAFLEIPSDGSYEMDYEVAGKTFDECVKRYASLVDAEMRDFRDIDVYSEKIGYEVQKVECCETCKWCLKEYEHNGACPEHVKPKCLRCGSPMNEQVFSYALQFPQFPHCKPFHGWRKLPWQDAKDIHLDEKKFGASWDPTMFPLILFPKVDPLGKCDNYAPREDMQPDEGNSSGS